MHTVPVARKVFLSTLAALALLAGAMFVATPKASAGLGQCSYNTVCAWSEEGWRGNFSWWSLNSGCHNHEGNPRLRSVYNLTTRTIEIPGQGERILPGGTISLQPWMNAITGVICT